MVGEEMEEVAKEEGEGEGEATEMEEEEIRLEVLGTGSNGSRHCRPLNCNVEFHDIRTKVHIHVLASGVYSTS